MEGCPPVRQLTVAKAGTVGATGSFSPVTINFGSCAAAARFSVNVGLAAGNGYSTTRTLTIQFR
jgi:hypothetical protein